MTADRKRQRLRVASLLAMVLLAAVLVIAVMIGGASRPQQPSVGGTPTPSVGTAEVIADPEPEATGPLAWSTTNVAGYDLTLFVMSTPKEEEVELKLERTSPASPPLTNVSKVIFKVTPQDANTGSTSYEAIREGDASEDEQDWKASETILAQHGRYLVTITVERTQSPDLRAAFELGVFSDSDLTVSTTQVVDISMSTLPSPPISGTVTLIVTLTNEEGKPIEGASVAVSAFAASHRDIESTAVAQPVPGQSGVYTCSVAFNATGSWLLIFNVAREGVPAVKVDHSLEVSDAAITPGKPISP